MIGLIEQSNHKAYWCYRSSRCVWLTPFYWMMFPPAWIWAAGEFSPPCSRYTSAHSLYTYLACAVHARPRAGAFHCGLFWHPARLRIANRPRSRAATAETVRLDVAVHAGVNFIFLCNIRQLHHRKSHRCYTLCFLSNFHLTIADQ